MKKIDMSANAKLIEGIQNADLNQHVHGNLRLVKSEGVTESYKCMYQIQSGGGRTAAYFFRLFKCYAVNNDHHKDL